VIELKNCSNGEWVTVKSSSLDVINPATSEVLAQVPISSEDHVESVVQHAREAFVQWRRTPVTDRIQYLFRYKQLLEENLEELANTISLESGKTLAEASGEIRRGIENVEVACGMPILMQGYNNEDIAPGIDEHLFRQPLGVVAAITPFNFPAMIPLWFLPYAIACGNCFILKPSEKTPLTGARLIELLLETGIPEGVVGLVHGAADTVKCMIQHPGVRAISFVGSTPVARAVYAEASRHGKRVQCQGGAKNPLVILPDADLEMTTQIVADSAFGCAGQRCLAASLAITVGDATGPFREAISEAAQSRNVGCGQQTGVEMGPVINNASRERLASAIEAGVVSGANCVVDGRDRQVAEYEAGSFLFPTVLDQVPPGSDLLKTELFGPVLGMMEVPDVDAAIQLVNSGQFGNMACLFTTDGAAARKFRYDANVGNIGINLGVAAPMAFFPFSGWRDSFFGDLHAQGRHGVEFYTETKVVVERWPDNWSRKF